MADPVVVPPLGESLMEAVVGQWLKKTGDTVNAGDPLVELETDKVNLEVTAERAGVLGSIAKAEGDTVHPGETLAELLDQETSGDGGKAQPAAPSSPEPPASPAAPEPPVAPRAAPAVRKLAQQQGVDLAQVAGSGAHGRILKGDVVGRPLAAERPRPSTPPPAVDQEDGATERVKMTRRRLTIARRLVEAQHTAAMLTTFNEIDMSRLVDLRSRHRDKFLERHGVRLGFMSFFARATVAALRRFPNMNAEIQGDEVLYKHYYDIGVAVSTDAGLVVPVVRDVDRKSLAEIEADIVRLRDRALNKELTMEELTGGTFTITNGGVFGSLFSTPILNAPQVGILGMHQVKDRPVAVDGAVVIRPMMYVALSYDHRLVDGSDAVRFLVTVKELIEDPERLLLDG